MPAWLNCKGNAVRGDHVRFVEPVYRGAEYIGDREIEGCIIDDEYIPETEVHVFFIRPIECFGTRASEIRIGSMIRRTGREIYRREICRKPWPDESKRDEAIADKARRRREWRIKKRTQSLRPQVTK